MGTVRPKLGAREFRVRRAENNNWVQKNKQEGGKEGYEGGQKQPTVVTAPTTRGATQPVAVAQSTEEDYVCV